MNDSGDISTLDGLDLAAEVMRKVRHFYTYLFSDPYYRRALVSWRTFNGFGTGDDFFDSIDIASTYDGSGGVAHRMKTGTYTAIGQSLISLTTAQRPNIVPLASNTDVASSQATLLAEDLLPYYFRTKGIERISAEAVGNAVTMQDGFVLQTWNATAGLQAQVEGVPLADPDSAQPYFTGDIEVRALTPFDVVRDLAWRGTGEPPYVITREFSPKYALMAQFPALAAEIEAVHVSNEPIYRWPDSSWATSRGQGNDYEQVPIFTIWHRKTRNCPAGLMARVVNDRILLPDKGPLPFGDHLPLYRVSAGVQFGTTKGRSPLILQLALQRGLDIGFSTAITNMAVFGPGMMAAFKGNGLNIADIGGGAKIIEVDTPEQGGGALPVPIAVPMTGPAIFQTTQMLTGTMESNTAINPSVRGTDGSDTSGTARLFSVEQARQFTSELQASYIDMYQKIANGLLTILKLYANSPQTAIIVGKNKAPFLRTWQGSNLQGVDQVTCQIGSTALNTMAGQLQAAQDLNSRGLLTPEQYLEVARTGNLETETDPIELVTLHIRGENEQLSQGVVPPVVFTDNDAEHLKWHRSVPSMPGVAGNMAALQAVYTHCKMHEWKMAQPPTANLPLTVPNPPPPIAPPPPPPPPALPPNTTGIVVSPPTTPGPPVVTGPGNGVHPPPPPSPQGLAGHPGLPAGPKMPKPAK